MTLKMKFIQDPRLEFFEKKSSRFIIVIIYIYIIYLIGLNLCPTLCLILCPVFLMLKNIKSLIYRIMHSLNTLGFVSGFVSRFVSHFVSDKYQREISELAHSGGILWLEITASGLLQIIISFFIRIKFYNYDRIIFYWWN